jgi:hypothetical protein
MIFVCYELKTSFVNWLHTTFVFMLLYATKLNKNVLTINLLMLYILDLS